MNAWIESVYSDGSQYFVSNPFPKMYEKVTIYIRFLETAPIDKIFISTEINGIPIKKEMYRDRVENGLVYYKIKIGTSDDILNYSFILLSDKVYYYTQKGITTYHQNVDYNFKILFGYASPVWAKKSICY